ncbi:sugar phosphate isomerase/epimerase, partial [Candidatus Aerophobetes bacterium]
CIEVSWVKDAKVRKRLSGLLRGGRMSVVYTQGPPAYLMKLNLHSLDSEDRKRSIEQTKKLIDEAYYFRASHFQIIGGEDPGEDRREQATEYLIDSLLELCEYAEAKAHDYCMIITLENLDRDVHKKFLIGPTAEAVAVVTEVKRVHTNIGLTLDLAHLPLLGESLQQALKLSREHVVHVHVGNCILRNQDNPRYGDTNPPFGIEDGENDVNEVTELFVNLDKIGFFRDHKFINKPVVSLEVKPELGEIPEIILAGSKRVLCQALRL